MGLRKTAIASIVLVACGCVAPGKFMWSETTTTYGAGPAVNVVTTWNSRVQYVPDPTKGGMPAPGLAGRVYLFGERQDYPVAGDGAIVVEMFDDTPVNGQAASTLVEQWHFDPATLQRLFKQDTIGMGYTLFLPWGTYRHDVKTVHLNLRYEPANGAPLFTTSEAMTIDHASSPTGPKVR